MADFSLSGLRLLRAIAAQGSFTAAAEALGYTQSSVSRKVAALEAATGTRLFDRRARGVRLTDAGAALLAHAVAVTDRLDQARRELEGAHETKTARLRLGAFPTALAALVPRAVSSLRTSQPDLVIALREGTTPSQLRRLQSGTADLAVVAALPAQRPDPATFTFEPLLEDRLLLAVPHNHPLAGSGSVELQQLEDESWVAATPDPDEVLLGVWPALDWRPRVAYIARDWTAKLGLVAAGLGITVLPGLAAPGIRNDIALVRVLGGDPGTRTVALATHKPASTPAAAQPLVDALHRAAAQLTQEIELRLQDR
jgi:DNA-binding transcriptional LysR family regulator